VFLLRDLTAKLSFKIKKCYRNAANRENLTSKWQFLAKKGVKLPPEVPDGCLNIDMGTAPKILSCTV
jgi:hypothetical protein